MLFCSQKRDGGMGSFLSLGTKQGKTCCHRKGKETNMKDKIFGVLQRIGRSFMLPIAILPVAGLLLGIGSSLTNATTIETYNLTGILGEGTILNALFTIMTKAGNAIFDNLPIIFAVGVAIGMAKKEKEVAALSAMIAFLVMNVTINALLQIDGTVLADGTISEDVLSGTVASVLGIQTLQMGVFGGIIVGLGVAALHNKYYKITLPNALSFFGGSRFVPIISTLVYVGVGILLFFVWPFVQNGIYALGGLVTGTGYFGTLIFGIIKRALIPFGLHHVFYLPFWQTSLGGTMEVAGKMVDGAQNIFFAQLADPATTHFNVEATRFMAGKFPLMIFGLPGAALAIYRCARPEQRKVVGGLMISAALTSMLTGITEPLEFTFLFIAPGLYAIHCIFAGFAYMMMHVLKITVGLTFSGGLIDLFFFGILQGQGKTNWMMVIPLGIIYFIVYYFLFHFLILKFDIKTPGREEETTIEFEEESEYEYREDFSEELLAKIAAGLGGKKNIGDIDCCVTRLRCGLKDISLVDDAMIRETGSRGILKRGNSIQIIYGPHVTVLKSEFEDYLRTRRAKKEIKQLLKENVHSEEETKQESIACPIKGKVIELEEVGDEAFSGGMLGEGFAVVPEEGKLYAPVDGIIAAVFRTKHALAMESKEGAEVLIHLGLDTVKRNGKGFYMKVEAGQKVKKGELICEFDLEDIKADGYVMTTPVVISNNEEYASIALNHIGECNVGEEILTIYK